MFNALIGFAVGVVAGPTFTALVWPKIVTWWKNRNTPPPPAVGPL
jgi:hypothetical protein